MKFAYTVKKEATGTQQVIAQTIAEGGQPISVNQLVEIYNKERPHGWSGGTSRGSILRVVQELEIKAILYISGKVGQSNLYNVNPGCIICD